MSLKKRRKLKKHWYFITDYECPVCSGGETLRERRFGRKPKSYEKTHEWISHYCGCLNDY